MFQSSNVSKDIKLRIQKKLINSNYFSDLRNFSLIFGGEQLEDDKTIQYFHITDRSLILMEEIPSETEN